MDRRKSQPGDFGGGMDQGHSHQGQFGGGMDQGQSHQGQFGGGMDQGQSHQGQFGGGMDHEQSHQRHFVAGMDHGQSHQRHFVAGMDHGQSHQRQFVVGMDHGQSHQRQFVAGMDHGQSHQRHFVAGMDHGQSHQRQFFAGTDHEQMQSRYVDGALAQVPLYPPQFDVSYPEYFNVPETEQWYAPMDVMVQRQLQTSTSWDMSGDVIDQGHALPGQLDGSDGITRQRQEQTGAYQQKGSGNRNTIDVRNLTNHLNPEQKQVVQLVQIGDNNTAIASTDTGTSKLNANAHTFIPRAQEQKKKFRDAVRLFKKNYFILMTDKLSTKDAKYSMMLTRVPWLAVFDFDLHSKETGLLNRLKEQITLSHHLHELAWNEDLQLSEESVNWIGMMGYTDRPDIRIEQKFREWRNAVLDKLRSHARVLQEYIYSTLTIVVLWPDDREKVKHFEKTIEELAEKLSCNVVIVCGEDRISEVTRLQEICEDVTIVHLNLENISSVIECDCKRDERFQQSLLQLPTADRINNPDLNTKEIAWLNDGLDVIYISNEKRQLKEPTYIEKEESLFHRGGTLSWEWWYTVGPGRADIKRDIHDIILNRIRVEHVNMEEPGIVFINHFPGSGGTTLGQRLLWDLRTTAPCVQLKAAALETSVKNVVDKIKFLYKKTDSPIIILSDGQDEQAVDQIYKMLSSECCIVIIVIRRCWEKLRVADSTFCLDDYTTQNESLQLKTLLSTHCPQRNHEALETIYKNASTNGNVSILEFGLAAYTIDYIGIQSYVKGYLRLINNDGTLESWQKALTYLALVYFYGQSNIPCVLLGTIFPPQYGKAISTIEDLPGEMQGLVVNDDPNGRLVRINHCLVAKEILDQVLTFPCDNKRNPSPYLCVQAKRRLKDLSVEFIETSAKFKRIRKVFSLMQQTFIIRPKKSKSKNASADKYGQFAPILEAASSEHPFTGRFIIMEALTTHFPHDAMFWAHRARLYSRCKPEDFEDAKELFERALKEYDNQSGHSPLDRMKNDLMHLYHMYGTLYSKRVFRFETSVSQCNGNIQQNREENEQRVILLIDDVEKSSELFAKCRNASPTLQNDSLGYSSEIKTKLVFCKIVKRLFGTRTGSGLLKYMYKTESPNQRIVQCLEKSIFTLDQLLHGWSTRFGTHKKDHELRQFQRHLCQLFPPGFRIPQYQNEVDSKAKRRLCNSLTRLTYSFCRDMSVSQPVESIQNTEELTNFMKNLNLNIEQTQKQPTTFTHSDKDVIDQEHKDLLFGLRHPKSKMQYNIDEALQLVNIWHDITKSTTALYYKFVLNSIIGIHYIRNNQPNTYMDRAKSIYQQLKHQPDNRSPFEWLGQHKDSKDIRNMVYLSTDTKVARTKQVNIQGRELALVTGTISPPNNNVSSGNIYLDLGPQNTESIKVKFAPNKTIEKLMGEPHALTKVEFVLGFSVKHGYEAYNVKKLLEKKCSACNLNVFKRSIDEKYACLSCTKRF